MRFIQSPVSLFCIAALSLTAVAQAASDSTSDRLAVPRYAFDRHTRRQPLDPRQFDTKRQPEPIEDRRRETLEDIDPVYTYTDAGEEWRRRHAVAKQLRELERPSRSREPENRSSRPSHHHGHKHSSSVPTTLHKDDTNSFYGDILMFDDDNEEESEASSSSSSGDSNADPVDWSVHAAYGYTFARRVPESKDPRDIKDRSPRRQPGSLAFPTRAQWDAYKPADYFSNQQNKISSTRSPSSTLSDGTPTAETFRSYQNRPY